jgi:hypothetical protein
LNRSSIVTNDKSPFPERWGGFYVTGTTRASSAYGQPFVRESPDTLGTIREYSRKADLSGGANITDLANRFDTKPYLSPHSDVAALMVLGHQTHIHNLITVAGTNVRSNPAESVIKEDCENVVEAMLFLLKQFH